MARVWIMSLFGLTILWKLNPFGNEYVQLPLDKESVCRKESIYRLLTAPSLVIAISRAQGAWRSAGPCQSLGSQRFPLCLS